MDFGDQIFRSLSSPGPPALLAKLRDRYRYVLVDEFQTPTTPSSRCCGLLAGEAPATSRWWGTTTRPSIAGGARLHNLLTFRRLYPDAREVVLADNYRSTQPILDAASRLIAYNNPFRLEVIAGIDKRLRSPRKEGPAVRHHRFDTVSAEADGVAGLIEERLAKRLSAQGRGHPGPQQRRRRPLPAGLERQGHPITGAGSRGLYAREEVRLLVAFLRLLANPEDGVVLSTSPPAELYGLPETELLRLNRYATKKNRPLLEILRGLPGNPDLVGVEGRARQAAARLQDDLDRAAQDVPRMRSGEVLYRFLQSSGFLGRLSKQSTAENEAKVKNIAKFFEAVKAYGDVAEHDRVPAFVEHLDLLREAGDDPAVAEADRDDEAVQVLTVHKAKGLEFPLVFIASCVEQKFPVKRRGEPLELPGELVKEPFASGDPHLQEERRSSTAMTRAKEEDLDLGLRLRHRLGAQGSRFAVEALDLPSPAPTPRKSQALEALAPSAGACPPSGPSRRCPTTRSSTSFRQLDDYETCPLKYKYVHKLRVPLLVHHRIVYGSAIHKAAQEHFRARLEGRSFSEDDLVAAFRAAWVSEGFLSREHEEERLKAGEIVLRRFHREEAQHPLLPTGVEKDFAFYVDRNRVQGRYDLVVERDGVVQILDFKTGAIDDPKAAKKRAQESLQLDVYALAHLKIEGRFRSGGAAVSSPASGAARVPTAEEAAGPPRRRSARPLWRSSAGRNSPPSRPTWRATAPFASPHTARSAE